jgi:hypothetical protein
MHIAFWLENLKGDHVAGVGVDVRIIFFFLFFYLMHWAFVLCGSSNLGEDNIKTDILKTRWESADWIYLAHDRDQWQVLVKTVTRTWGGGRGCIKSEKFLHQQSEYLFVKELLSKLKL